MHAVLMWVGAIVHIVVSNPVQQPLGQPKPGGQGSLQQPHQAGQLANTSAAGQAGQAVPEAVREALGVCLKNWREEGGGKEPVGVGRLTTYTIKSSDENT